MHQLIAGVDEAGIGSLVGEVTVAAVILPNNFNLPGLNDSKKLSEKKRNILYHEIKKQSLSYTICSCDVRKIEEINILQATMLAMKNAIINLTIKPSLIYVDGNQLPNVENHNIKAIVNGDSKIPSISAASILAKVERDKKMYQLHLQHPQYHFNKHKGYATLCHVEAIKKFGIIDQHRKTFAPIKYLLP